MTKRVIELIRVSTKDQARDDRASIPAQRAVNARTAQQHGLEIVKTIIVSDVSGAAVLAAPEIQELLRLIADPEIHGVVVREFSRLMRPDDFTEYALLQGFLVTNTVIYTPDGCINFANSNDQFMATIHAGLAGMERRAMLEKMWASKEVNRRAGKFSQSKVCLPFGVEYDNGFHYTEDAERVAEAFRLFLSGDTSYKSVGRKVGIAAFNLRNLLANPIFTGWRVIDERRDPSPAARRVKAGGRQGDRRKIQRKPEDVIRVKVIEKGLVSEADFKRVQQFMAVKKTRHWRTRSDYVHRYTYNGFLNCAACGELVYTRLARDDYYVCKARGRCQTRYMRRDIVEPELDYVFGQRLTDERFLRQLMATDLRGRPDTGQVNLEQQMRRLELKRARVIESYLDGLMSRADRDARLAVLDRDIANARQKFIPTPRNASPAALAGLCEVFMEWAVLSRGQKRRILATVAPEIRIADYKLAGVNLMLPNCSDDVNLVAMDFNIAASVYLPLNIELRTY